MQDEVITALIVAAKSARLQAYVPYSQFAVGAAVQTKGGQIFTGCNIENAAYGCSMCAERTAIFKAVSAGYKELVALAVVDGAKQVSPCGSCRQVMAEFNQNMVVILANEMGEYKVLSLTELLPEAFTDKDLTRLGGNNDSKNRI